MDLLKTIKLKILYKQLFIEKIYRYFFKRLNNYLIKNLFNSKIIPIFFLVHDLRQWHLSELYFKFKKSSIYKPTILIVPYKDLAVNISQTYTWFLDNGYDVEAYPKIKKSTKILLKSKRIQFYTSPYVWFYPIRFQPYFNPSAFTAYVPYQITLKDNLDHQYSNLFFRYLNIYFAESSYTLSKYKTHPFTRFNSVLLSGHPSIDIIRSIGISKKEYRLKNKKVNILWTPHHSINENGYSSFLELKDYFIKLANEDDNFHIIFRPHPQLAKRLESRMSLVEITDYYNSWTNSPHGDLDMGDYIESMTKADLIVNDSLTFAILFQFSSKPMILSIKQFNHNLIPELKNSLKKVPSIESSGELDNMIQELAYTSYKSEITELESYYPSNTSNLILGYFYGLIKYDKI